MDTQRAGYIYLCLTLLLSEILVCEVSHFALQDLCRMQIPTDLCFWIFPILVLQ